MVPPPLTMSLLGIVIVGCLVGAAAGYLGAFMVLKRMALVGDALSHVALPGIALGLTFHFAPMIGAFMALLLSVLGIWYFESSSKNYPEALVGVFFTFSLALGMVLTPEPELLEALFGNIETITFSEGLFAAGMAILVICLTYRLSSKLLISIISTDIASSLHLNPKYLNLVYLLLVGSCVAIGVKFVGTLLMGALVIIPAVSAKNISKHFATYTLLSMVFGVVAAGGGALLAALLMLPTGPVVVLTGVVIFLLTYAFKPN